MSFESPKRRGRRRNEDKPQRQLTPREHQEAVQRSNQAYEELTRPKPKRLKTSDSFGAPQPNPIHALQPVQPSASLPVSFSHQQQPSQQFQQPVYYTKEKIDAALLKYERMSAEYSERGLTYTIKHYVKRMPEVCQKLKYFRLPPSTDCEDSKIQIQKILMDTVRSLMMDEFEIIHWAKFIDRFDFSEATFAMSIHFIAVATKLLLNPQKEKDPYEVQMSRQNPNFPYFNIWMSHNGWVFYQDFKDHITSHKLYIKLRQGMEPKFDYEDYMRRRQEEELAENSDYNKLVDELLNQKYVELIRQGSVNNTDIGSPVLAKRDSMISKKSSKSSQTQQSTHTKLIAFNYMVQPAIVLSKVEKKDQANVEEEKHQPSRPSTPYSSISKIQQKINYFQQLNISSVIQLRFSLYRKYKISFGLLIDN